MKRNIWTHGLTLGLAAIMALGAVGVASAKTRTKDFLGVWQLDARQGDGWNHQGGDYGRPGDWGGNDGNYGRQGDWGDDDGAYYGRQGRGDRGDRRDSRQDYRGARGFGALPATFRIDRDHRQFQLESMQGRLLREMDTANNRQLVSQRTFMGTTIVETYSLSDRGRRLLVRTSIRGARGSREMTSIYERA